MIKILLCDDELFQVELMEFLIYKSEVLENVRVLKATTPGEFIDILDKEDIDIAFIDIELNDHKNGIDLGRHLREKCPEAIVVFVTAYKKYGYESYSIKALDYILKPICEESFKNLLVKVKQEYNKSISIDSKKVFIANCPDRIIRIPYKDIYYFEKIQRKVRICCKSYNVEINASLKSIMKNSEVGVFFFQCHQGYLVNKSKIVSLCGNKLDLVEKDITLPVGRKYKKVTKEEVLSQIFD